MDVKLVIKSGAAKKRGYKLQRDETIIGRRRDCDLCIPSGEVSRRHCILRIQNDDVVVEDLDSANGTFVNNERVTTKQKLNPGDVLLVGPVTFKVVIGSEAAAPANAFDFAGQPAGGEAEVLVLEEAEDEPPIQDAEILVLEEAEELPPLPVEDEVVVLDEVAEEKPKKAEPPAKPARVAPPPTVVAGEPTEEFEVVFDEPPEHDQLQDILREMDKQ